MSLDAITDSNKEAHRSSRPAKGKGGRGRGNKGKGGSKGRGRGSKGSKGGFKGGGGAARQGRSYGDRRQAPYQGGAPRRNFVNDDFDDEEDDFEDDEEEEEEYEAPARSLQTKSARAALSTGTSVQVSNLHADVTEEDMHELFSTAISGDAPVSIKSTCVNYDKNGKCNGTATITFVRKGDGMAAIKEYNGVPLDGQPMQLDIVGAPTADQQRAPVRSRPQFRAEQSFEPRQQTFQRNTFQRNSRGRGKGKGSKGGKGRGGGKGPREDRAPVTETDLDDGLDDYFKDE